jgi:hypothetical protein
MMISVLDHPTIPTSLEALADGLIDPDDLPVSEGSSILDRGDSKREETPRTSPFLAPPPKTSILAPAEGTATDGKTTKTPEPALEPSEVKDDPAPTPETATDDAQDAPSDGETGKDAKEPDGGDIWPDPKTGPILVAGGSIADAVGLATALDDPEETSAEQETASVDTAELADSLDAELTKDINAELSISAEDIGTDPDQSPDEVLIDLQIEDLVAEEFTETAQPSTPEPSIPPLPDQAESSTTDEMTSELAKELANEIGAETTADDGDNLDELFADIGADLTPEAPVKTASIDPLESLDIAPEELLEDLQPLEPVTLEPTPGTSETAQASAQQAEEKSGDKTSTKELSEEVDELLSRLMSDGPSGAPAEDVELDVVPER